MRGITCKKRNLLISIDVLRMLIPINNVADGSKWTEQPEYGFRTNSTMHEKTHDNGSQHSMTSNPLFCNSSHMKE